MTDLLLNPAFVTAFIVAAIGATMPLLLSAAGETVGEQSGVLNLGIEGVILVGAYTAYVVMLTTESLSLAVICGMSAGVAFSLVMLILSVYLGLNQIVIGLAMTLIGGGLTSVLYLQQYAERSPGTGVPDPFRIEGVANIPIVGSALFQQPLFFWICIMAVGVLAWFMRNTNWGLSIRAAGQKPAALDAAGGNVLRARTWSVLLGGASAGAGGAYLVLLTTSTFTPFMTNGLGYVAIVVAMLSRGKMMWVSIISLVYGLTVAAGTALQLTELSLPADLIKMLPFIVVMIMLVLFSRRGATPPALGSPYVRGER